MNNQLISHSAPDPRPNKIDEIKEEPVLNEQDEKLAKEEKVAEKDVKESWGDDKDGFKKETLTEINVDTSVVNGEQDALITNE